MGLFLFMTNATRITITFIYKGKIEKRNIDRMYIDILEIKEFYRIPGKKVNYDIYKKDGVWLNVTKTGLSDELLQLVGNAIDAAKNIL